ncbi:MAG: phosphoribosylamine--glycine ligase [Candidatus Bathyarchaeia archaeon]
MLIIGNGGREHAIAKKLSEEDIELHAAMSSRNPGIAKLAKRIEIFDINQPENFERFRNVDIAFIGPESPLASGVSDFLSKMGIPVIGPTRELARLEWSKSFTRSFLNEQNIEGNPEFKICRNLDDIRDFLSIHENVAVKPDVLTGGKGVKLTGEHLKTVYDVESYALERISMDGLVVLEEKLVGREFTLQAFTDGIRVEVMPLVRDYKRAFDRDQGPNTGSMGSFNCPDHSLPDLPKAAIDQGASIMRKTVKALAKNTGLFKGVLYGGFMNTENGVYLLEYNVRFGDPEAINVLALMETSLLDIGWRIIDERLSRPSFESKATVCVYLVPPGYPANPEKNMLIRISGFKNSELYYASVHEKNGGIYTTSSRALAVLAKGETVQEARERVYGDLEKMESCLYFRKDIAEGF